MRLSEKCKYKETYTDSEYETTTYYFTCNDTKFAQEFLEQFNISIGKSVGCDFDEKDFAGFEISIEVSQQPGHRLGIFISPTYDNGWNRVNTDWVDISSYDELHEQAEELIRICKQENFK